MVFILKYRHIILSTMFNRAWGDFDLFVKYFKVPIVQTMGGRPMCGTKTYKRGNKIGNNKCQTEVRPFNTAFAMVFG